MSSSTSFASFVQNGVSARRHPRARFASTVYLKLPGGQLLEARTQDISLGGVQLVVPMSVAPGTACGVRLLIPGIPFGVRTVTAEATVTSLVFSGKAAGFVIGLRFTSVPQSATLALREYLQQRNGQHGFSGGAFHAVGADAPAAAQAGEPVQGEAADESRPEEAQASAA